jgi:hypothetical protein
MIVIDQLFERRGHISASDQLGLLPAGWWLMNGTSMSTSMSSSLFHGDLLPGTIANKCNSEESWSSAKRRSNNQNVVVM